MEMVVQGLSKALAMLLAGDPEVWRVTWLTLKISGAATLISVLVGVPVGVLLALTRFRGRGLLVSLVNTGMGLPPVVVGLAVSILFWRYGPFGSLRWMYTPVAMIIAQCMIAMPLVMGFTLTAIQQLNPKLRLQILALGASPRQLYWLLIKEARLGILAAVMAGFGGVISEVGASMMVGGNLLGQTRILTTSIVMEVSKGNFDVAIALSLVLMLIIWGVTYLLTYLQQRGRHT